MPTTWILTADRARARLFATDDDGRTLTELQDFFNPEGRDPEALYSHDRPPRAIESVGSARHAIEARTSAGEKVADRFAHELSAALERGRVDHQYQRLVLAAAPPFLGVLRSTLGKQVMAQVVAALDSDLTRLPADEIRSRLAPQLRH